MTETMLSYADDILITARTQQTLIDTFGKLKDISSQYGLIVNESKTKYMKCTRRENTVGKLRAGDIQIDQVKSFNYLGSTMNGNSTLEEEIRERIAKGNRAFYANKALFTSKLVSRRSKLKLYWTVIRPVVVYGCETWVLKENIIQKLSVFERKILRKVFGPTKKKDGSWKIKMNIDLDKLIQHRNIINYIKAQRLSWYGHICREPETSIVKKIHKWQPNITRPVGRHKHRWDDDVRNDLRKMKLLKWTEQAQDRHEWKKIVEKAKTLDEM